MPIFGPDNGSAYVFLPNGKPAVGTLAVIFEDAGLTIPAAILAYLPHTPDVPGGLVPLSTVVVNAYGRMNFWFPDDMPVLYVTVSGGPAVRITADLQTQMDSLLDAFEELAIIADPSAAVAAHNADTTAVHGIPDTSILETQDGSTAKAVAAQVAATNAASTDATNKAAAAASAAISAAASDATTKANAAQSAAISAAATDATTKANAAQAAAIAASDPVGAATAAQSAAIAVAATDATTKAGTAQANATAAAATDATTKASAAQAAAIAAAATDATTKASAAQAAATAAAATDATSKVSAHAGAADPHGDRAYADTAVGTLSTATTSALAGKQPADSDLTTIAALDSAQSGVVASDGAGWLRKTYAQLKTALGLAKADVGLGNVDNTTDAGKPVSTAQQTALNLKVDKRATRRSVADYGAVGDALVDGSGTDDRVAIQAALNAGPGIVELTGWHKLTTPGLTIPADVWLRGAGESTGFIPTANYNYNVVQINNTNGRASDFIIKRVTGSTSIGPGVAVLGASADAIVERVIVQNASSGFRVAGWLGTGGGTTLRAVFRGCIAKNSEAYGFELDECDGVELDDCQSIVHYQDGVKIRRKAKNTRVNGGYFSGGIIGDGMDCYAGGDQFLVSGAVFSGNAINGITIKNDDLNRLDSATYGFVRNFSIVGCIATGNTGNGFTCHRSSGTPDDPTEPLVARGIFSACGSYGNSGYGYYLQSRQITLQGCTSARNGLHGFMMMPVCRDIAFLGCHAAGNGVTTVNTYDGFLIDGSRIQLMGCSSIGSDPDGAVDDAALAAGTKQQRYGFNVVAAATQVDYLACRPNYNATADFIDASGKVNFFAQAPGVYLSAGQYLSTAGTRSTVVMTQSVEYAIPVYIANAGTIIRIGCEVTAAGAAATVIRLGVRTNLNGVGVPGTVLLDTTVAGDAITAAGIEATVSLLIQQPGLYYFTATAQGGTPTVRSCTGPTGIGASAPSLATAVGATPNGGFITAATVTGALGSTYTISNRSGGMPLIVFRA